jgi:molybdopterin synthase sulfur carrier subunit
VPETTTATVTVRLPTVLRPQARGQSTVRQQGATVGQVIDGLVGEFPGLKPNLLDDQGNVRRFVNLYVNDEDIRFLDQLDTPLHDGDEVTILPAVAGG